MTQELVTRIVRGDRAERLLLLVHGLGTDENDLAALVPHLDPGGTFLAVLPRGPHAVPPGFAWYPIGPGQRDPDVVAASLDRLDDALDAACATHGMARDQAILAGFSQGAAMVAALAYRADSRGRARPAGVVAMSGFLQDGDSFRLAVGDDLPPALVQHGTHDPMVPAHRGRRLGEMLAARGVPVVYKEYPMQHQVVLESIDDARDWLAAVLDGQRPSTVEA